jgi:signal transduction histidine kinase
MASRSTADPSPLPWRHVGQPLLTGPSADRHIVQFYEDDAFLVGVVADFFEAGLALGEPLVAITTAAHAEGLRAQLAERGVDVDAVCASGQLTLLDARETLGRFMADGMPDAARFRESIGGVLERSQARSCHARVRAFGEMVDVLWQDGQPQAALQLEALWNALSTSHSFSLLCGYALGRFGREAEGSGFRAVCGAHSHVIPTERYAQLAEPDSRLRAVSLLQQRALVLEREIEHRKQVEQQLREALAVRDDFLSVAGHELRTPLTTLRLQVHALQGAVRAGTVSLGERVTRLSHQVRRLSALIDDLLDVSRINAGRLTLELEPLELGGLVRDAVERVSEAVPGSAQLIRVLAQEGVEGRWDGGRIEQVVVNLVVNALKYGPGKPVELTVTATAERARLTVRDYGIGIAPEAQARIFDRFERAVSSRHYGGLGLGLWISRQLVQAHRGGIRVESVPGEGATFIVELPLR